MVHGCGAHWTRDKRLGLHTYELCEYTLRCCQRWVRVLENWKDSWGTEHTPLWDTSIFGSEKP